MSNNRTAVLRGPQVSHNLPMIRRARIVEDTDAIITFPTCALVRPRSARIVGISGANPNHPKKHTKNISQVIWKVRIWIVPRENKFIFSSGSRTG